VLPVDFIEFMLRPNMSSNVSHDSTGGKFQYGPVIKCGADWMLAGPRAFTSGMAMREAKTRGMAARPARMGVREIIFGSVELKG